MLYNVIFASLFLTGLFATGLVLGRRIGYAEGISAWRKDYRRMSAKDIAQHKKIIRAMPDDPAA